MIDILYANDAMAKDARYEGDEDVDCRIIIRHDLTEWGDVIKVQNDMAMISVRTSEVPERPRRGGIFTLATGKEYTVEQAMRPRNEYEHQVLVVSDGD